MLKLGSLVESGCSNVLNWAIKGKANLKDNVPMVSLINDETFYLLTIEGVNFYQLFRLTQNYRNKLRIIENTGMEMPEKDYLVGCFGPEHVDEAYGAIKAFVDIATQMQTDTDIIPENVSHLFIPMIARKYSVQIPIDFVDILDMLSDDPGEDGSEYSRVFNTTYPATLENIWTLAPGVRHQILTRLIQMTGNIVYNPKYMKLIEMSKYAALQAHDGKPYKTGLVGFKKYNPMTRGEVKHNIFQSAEETLTNTAKVLNSLKTPLEVSVAVQLPIFQMQQLEASYYPEDLIISFRSSIHGIVANGIIWDDFIIDETNEETKAAISNYKMRISTAHLQLVEVIQKILSIESYTNSEIFSMLPPIFMTNAVLTFPVGMIEEFANHKDLMISSMFKVEIAKIISSVESLIFNGSQPPPQE